MRLLRPGSSKRLRKLPKRTLKNSPRRLRNPSRRWRRFFADDPSIKVTRTDPFSELTGGDVGVVNGQIEQSPFRLSQPEGLHAPGPEFMEKVFQLKDGETAGLLSHDHTIAYVVRVVEHQPSINELRTAYLGEADTWSGLGNMIREPFSTSAINAAAGYHRECAP